jgi:DNA-binding LacI/PurR family transcriptional regulator
MIMKKMTIKEVAKAIGVSTATISNAFNRPDQLSEALRTKILSKCQELGYVGPSAAGRYLRTGRSGVVGIVLTDRLAYSMNDYVASHFLSGLADEFDKAHLNMLLLSARDLDHANRQRLHESMVDGFIVYGFIPPGPTLEHLKRQQKRLIVVDHKIEGYGSVNIDNREASYQIAKHALKQTPKNPAILALRITSDDGISQANEETLKTVGLRLSLDRLNGYFDAFDEAGIERPMDQIWNLHVNDYDEAFKLAYQVLSQPNRPDLLLCQSDVMAIAAMRAALQMGIQFPEELRITGFDGIPEAQAMPKAITTIQQHSFEKGRMAAKLFIENRMSEDVVMPTELLIGYSCP